MEQHTTVVVSALVRAVCDLHLHRGVVEEHGIINDGWRWRNWHDKPLHAFGHLGMDGWMDGSPDRVAALQRVAKFLN